MHLNAGVWNSMSMNASGFWFCFNLDYIVFFLSEKVNKCSFNSQRDLSLNTFLNVSLVRVPVALFLPFDVNEICYINKCPASFNKT